MNKFCVRIFETIILTVITFAFAYPQDTITPPDSNGPTKVYMSIVLNNISEINAVTQTMKGEIFLVAKWKDPRLAHSGTGRVVKKLDDIWDPWLAISNRLNVNKAFSDVATVLSDGTVIYMQSLYGDFIQDFQFKDFPFDKQNFSVIVVAIGLSAKEVEFVPDPEVKSGVSDELRLPDWQIMNARADTKGFRYFKEQHALPTFSLLFEGKRVSGYYTLIYIIPLVLIIMMSWMAFWLDPSMSSSQLSVATTSMLTLIAYRFVVIGNLPKISYMTRMDIFVLGSSVLIFLTLLESAITSTINSRGNAQLAKKMDYHCRWIFPLLYLLVVAFAFAS